MSEEKIQTIMYALEIMGKGMLSIFVVIMLLTFIVVALTKITNLPMFTKNNDTQK